jgi:hypothetical protein
VTLQHAALAAAALATGSLALWRWLRRPVESCPARPAAMLLERGDAAPLAAAIPRRLWSYWHQGEPPLVVRRCLANWRRQCPGWDIRLVRGDAPGDAFDAADLPAGFHQLTPARQSDWLRLALLRRHGGVWIDASTLLGASPDWMVEAQAASGAQYLGFYLQRYTQDAARPIVDSWCMAAPPGSAFVSAWYDEFVAALALGDAAYLDGLRRRGDFERLRQGIADPAYLLVHMCAQVVLDRAGGHRLQLWKAEDGPYFLHQRSRWRRPRLYWRLLLRRAPARLPALVKLRGGERRKLEPYLAHGRYMRDSIVGRLLPAESGDGAGDPGREPR